MTTETYEYKFGRSISMQSVEETLLLAVIAAEALHGRSSVNLDADFVLSEKRRRCSVNGSNQVGRDIARIFTGLLTAEIGETGFQIERSTAGS